MHSTIVESRRSIPSAGGRGQPGGTGPGRPLGGNPANLPRSLSVRTGPLRDSAQRVSLWAMLDGFVDESGLVGVCGHHQAGQLTTLGLAALQHRGRSGAGLVISDGTHLHSQRGRGPVDEAFAGESMQTPSGRIAIGHVGDSPAPLAWEQPVVGSYRGGPVALAMAGRITNRARLRKELQASGAVFSTRCDAEILLHLLARSGQRTFVNRLVDALWKVEGAYAVMVINEDRLVAVRDPRGFRPLVTGKLTHGRAIATGEGPLQLLHADEIAEVVPGEMLIIEASGRAQSVKPFRRAPLSRCIHEFVSLAPTDTHAFGQSVYATRVALGERLGRDCPTPPIDAVVGLPSLRDGGGAATAAIGFARAVRRPLQEGLLAMDLSERGLVAPADANIDLGPDFRAVRSVADGQRLALIAASLGSGAMLRLAVSALKNAGAREIHVRVASPSVRKRCGYGVQGPAEEDLATRRHDGTMALADWLGATSVGFLADDAMRAIAGAQADGTHGWCDGCFTGNFPIPPEEPDDQLPLFLPTAAEQPQQAQLPD